MGNVVFFYGTDAVGASGLQYTHDLWISDGTAAGTYAIGGDQNAGVAGANYGLDPSDITRFGGGILFSGADHAYVDASGLWFSDGTAAGTDEIGGAKNSGVAGVNSTDLDPSDITIFGNEALFFGDDSDNFSGLWVTNGTASGTFELGGLKNSGIVGKYFAGLEPEELTPAGNKVIFVARDTDDYTGLWVTNGTTSGTIEIGGLNNAGISGAPSSGFGFPQTMDTFGNGVIFSFGNSIWVSDGTTSGTVEIASKLTNINDLTVFGTKVLFEAEGTGGGLPLWITDGTAAGTTEIGGAENAGIVGVYAAALAPSDITVFGGKALFLGVDSGDYRGLWVTDGTAAGTTEIGGLKNAGISGQGKFGLKPANFASVGNKVLFTASDPSGQQTLWVTNGTATGTFELGGTNNVGVIGAPAAGLDPSSITVSGGIAYFSYPDSTGTERLWESDGTVAGTHVVDAGPTGLVSNPGDLTAAATSAAVNAPTADILWQNTGGQLAIWELAGVTPVDQQGISPDPGPDWKAVGTGDFNGDGNPDILWQNTSGQVAIWEMNGTNPIAQVALGLNPGPSWKTVGTGDFNGDGKSDILFQNTDGQVAIWEMNETNPIAQVALGLNPGPAWQVVGAGDFNGDGKSDILFQNTDGQVAIWEMNGTTPIAQVALSLNPGPDWKAIGTGDFNADGKSDILFQNTDGQVAIWEMNGLNPIAQVALSLNPGPDWKAIGTNGGSEILFQNASGQAAIWDMNGLTPIDQQTVAANPGPTWRSVGLT